MEASIILSIISLSASVLTVLITSVCSLKKTKYETQAQTYQKQFELFYSEKSKVYEDFATKAPLLVTDKESIDRYDDYYTSALKVALLCDSKPRELIDSLLSFTNTALLNGMHVDKTWEISYLQQLSEITMLLNQELKETSDMLNPTSKQ